MQSISHQKLETVSRLRCAIAEDLPQNSTHLKKMLKMVCPEVEVSHETGSLSGLEEILANENFVIDMIFLDIYLADGLAFQLVPKIKKQNIDIVFCTAYSEYTLKAFAVDATHYLMKPIDPDDLQEAVHRVKLRRALYQQAGTGDADSDPTSGSKLIISAMDGTYVLDHDEILRCKGDNNYTDIWLVDGRRIKVSQTLNKVVKQVENADQFYRVHKSHVVNLNYLVKLTSKEGHQVILKDGTLAPIAKRRYKAFRAYLEKWKGG